MGTKNGGVIKKLSLSTFKIYLATFSYVIHLLMNYLTAFINLEILIQLLIFNLKLLDYFLLSETILI